MTIRHFALMGPVLRVEAENERLADQFAGLLRGLAVEPCPEPAFELSISLGTPRKIPGSADVIYQGPIFWEGECIFAAHDGLLHLSFPDKISVTIDSRARSAAMVVAPDSVSRVAATAGMTVVDAAIDASGQFMLHAAGLTLPGSEAQVLVFAQSGTGKTTTSLALAESGFGLCADDSMVIRVDGADATGWGLPRDLKVHRKTADMLPWLEPYLKGKWNHEDEQGIARDALSDRLSVAQTARRPIAGVFLLERGAVAKSEAKAFGQTETLVALTADNVRTGRTGLLASQRRRFAGLAALTMSTPTFKLTVGSEPQSTAPAVMNALGRIA